VIGRGLRERGQRPPAEQPAGTAPEADGSGSSAAEITPGPVLEVADLHVTFRTRLGTVYAVQGVSFAVEAGRTLAVIGESGSGKTVSARAIMGLLPHTADVSGSIRFQGEEVVGRSEQEMRDYRGRNVAMVFQNPERSLNPTMRVGTQIVEAIRTHVPVDRRQAHNRAIELLTMVRIPAPERRFHEYPHQLSGGMRQRVVIAIALACGPAVLIADEATTALDVTTQAQIMDLLLDLQQETGTALLMISHDMGLAASYAEDVVVMYAGKIVERAPALDLFADVRMPYTRALLEAIPRIELEPHVLLPVVGGRPPDMSVIAAGCPFAPRCPGVQQDCREQAPPLREYEPGRWWACWHPCGKRVPQ
jgi:oligopeptide/dipeptide ABC transporter ATP-binding protein